MPPWIEAAINKYSNLSWELESWFFDKNWRKIWFAIRWLNAGFIGILFFFYSWNFLNLKHC